ncbi:LysR family transcriptional regulator [Burkholderia sp. ABCPW 111]|uniref:LysR family transcriptional regulator n=1 Tax=Burkholderia sp. ABCPW 111 TaxID=1820025 RepID=UPI000530D3AB|nr:LysR family transcriptional regulator [Burkholderia sp. ABCPW 111]KGS03011.1 bacterial regulatory helix-turn-helix, lysR family protein [Burkholderia sp. ABCPW 111]
MQLRTLRYFQELAHCASLRKASERLHVAPTAISRQIEQLEHHFGAPLLERGPRGIRLTAEGEFLAERIDSVLRELDEVKTLISARRNLDVGSVSVYASEGIVSGLLAPVLAEFTRRHPRIRFDITVASAQHTLDALCQGRADLGVGFYLPHRADVEILDAVDLSHRVLVPPTHPLSARARVTLAELVDQPLAIPDAAFGVRQALERIAKRSGVTLEPLFTTCSLETQKALARQGAALLILPCFTPPGANGAAPADDTDLHALPIADAELRQVSVALCVYRYRPRSIAVNTCVEMLKEAMARQRQDAGFGEKG